MKFLVDAQLPRRLARRLREEGFDAIHTFDLSNGNRTSDDEINAFSLSEQRIVVTKDSDFVNTFVSRKEPWKLLLVSVGNIRNSDLEMLVVANLSEIEQGFLSLDYIEISRTSIIYHS